MPVKKNLTGFENLLGLSDKIYWTQIYINKNNHELNC
jgi:hypothetical protein